MGNKKKKIKGFDYLILKLGKPGKIFDIDIDTTHFNGNQPTHASLEGCLSKTKPNKETKWISCLLYTSPSPRDGLLSRMPSSA